MDVILIIALFIIIVIAVIICLSQKEEICFWKSMYKDLKKTSDEILKANKDIIDGWEKTAKLNGDIIEQSEVISENAKDILASNRRLIGLLEAAKEINKEKVS